MADSPEKKRSLKEKLTDRYRLVILDDDTLGEIKVQRFTFFGLFAVITFMTLLVGALTYLLVAFTPIKYLIPGYGEIESNKTYLELIEKIDGLEKDISTQRVYTESIKNILNPSHIKPSKEGDSSMYVDNYSTNEYNYAKISNDIDLNHYYFCKPIEGVVSAEFDIGIEHYGIDLVAPKDTPVKSILDGVVINADWSTNTGNTISIQHDNNIVSVYKHNSVLLKNIGEKVSSCEAIAIIGNTGKLTSGPHVHFEIWNDGIAVNPKEYLNF